MKKALMLRTVAADRRSHGGFEWPESGPVVAPDWRPTNACGNGLHGLLWGEGDAGLLHDPEDPDTLWQVVEVDADSVIDLGGKVKVPAGDVVFTGSKDDALAFLDAHGAEKHAVVYGTATAGDHGTATAGYYGTATAGYYGTATAGYHGTATAGYGGTLIIRYWDLAAGRYRTRMAEVGIDGIEANTPYRLDEAGQFVLAEEAR